MMPVLLYKYRMRKQHAKLFFHDAIFVRPNSKYTHSLMATVVIDKYGGGNMLSVNYSL